MRRSLYGLITECLFKNIEHLRLGFYTGDIFTQQPDRHRDVEPILECLRQDTANGDQPCL